ncbi:putative ribonuclease H-like domain-containing protein [Tanacetum coccineum]
MFASNVPAGRSDSLASRNRQASILAGSRISPASVPAVRSYSNLLLVRSDSAASRNNPQSILLVHQIMRFVLKDSICSLVDQASDCAIKEAIVKFGGGDGRISGKGTIRTSKLDFENVYYVEELQHFNLFSVVLRIPRKHDLYTFHISHLQPEQKVTCLVAKASLDESTRWHRRMAHVNFKTINKLAKEGLVDGLPLKVFTNEHNCVAANKGKQHKASYKHMSAIMQEELLSFKDKNMKQGRSCSLRLFFLTSNRVILFKAEAEIRNQGVSAVTDPAGIDSAVREPAGIVSADGVSTGSPSAVSDSAGSHPADCFPPAGSVEPTDESNPAVSSSVSAEVNPVYTDESTLPPGQQLGSSENTTRFPVPSDVCMDQISSGIFTSSSYDDDFRATLTNLAPAVEVNPVPTKRVHTIHPQSQILGDLASPVMTRSRAQKSKFGESALIGYIQDQQRTNHTDQLHCLSACFLSQLEPTSIAKALEDPDWVDAMQEEMQQFFNHKFGCTGTPTRGGIDYEREIEEKCMFTQPKGLKILLPKACKQSGLKLCMDIIKHLELVYVDDIIFGSTNKAWCDEFEVLMKGEFEMSAMGEMTFFLGLQVKQLPDGIFISQDKYVKDMLTKFDMESVRTATTPYEAAKTKLKDETDPPVNVHLYRSMIGSLMYLTASRPDIMFAVSACSRHQVTPLTSHLNAVKKIFKYLKGQPKLGLWYPKDSPFQLEAYSDSDYAGSHGDRKSTTGGCQFLGRRLISWQCKKQTIVATSSTEAEYVAAASCCAQVLWIQNQLLDYGFNFMNTKIFIDNQSTICIVKNPVFHQRTKHIEIRHHFIRDANEKNLIQVLKIHTDDNVADLLTKTFDGPRFEYLVVHIGMVVNTAASCTIFLLTAMDYAAGSVFMLVGIFLLVDSFLLMGFVYAANTSIYAAELVCAGSIKFLLADLFLLVVTCFCCLNLVSAVLSLILLVGWSLPLVTWFLVVVSIHAGVTMYPKSSVHVLDLTNGKTVYMFVDKIYPIRATLLERMLRHKLIVPPSYCRDGVVAGNIIQTGLRQSYECLASTPLACTARQMVFSSPWLTPKKESGSPLQTALVCNSNPLIALASPEQTATGKDVSNPLYGCDGLPKTVRMLFFDVAASFDFAVHRVHAVSFDAAVASTVSAAC